MNIAILARMVPTIQHGAPLVKQLERESHGYFAEPIPKVSHKIDPMSKIKANMGVAVRKNDTVLDGGLYTEYKRLRRD